MALIKRLIATLNAHNAHTPLLNTLKLINFVQEYCGYNFTARWPISQKCVSDDFFYRENGLKIKKKTKNFSHIYFL